MSILTCQSGPTKYFSEVNHRQTRYYNRRITYTDFSGEPDEEFVNCHCHGDCHCRARKQLEEYIADAGGSNIVWH